MSQVVPDAVGGVLLDPVKSHSWFEMRAMRLPLAEREKEAALWRSYPNHVRAMLAYMDVLPSEREASLARERDRADAVARAKKG